MHVHLGKVVFDATKKIFVPLQRQRGVHAALHQDLVTAEGDRLLDLFEDHVAFEDVSLGAFRPAVERAEVADRRTDVGVVDVSIDVVGAIGLRMEPPRDRISRAADRREVVRLQQCHRVGRRQSPARDHVIEDGVDGSRGHHTALLGSGTSPDRNSRPIAAVGGARPWPAA